MSRALRYCPILVALLALSARPSLADGGSRPIIAVFNVEDRGAGLGEDMLDRLTDYLTASLGTTGSYQVLPRSQIRERLVDQKKESYKSCYDQSCQIEIGKELAAQKSLSTQIIRLGSKCMVTAVTYDLRRSASEGGARAEGGCSEDDLAKSLQTIIAQLVSERSAAPARPVVAAVRPAVGPAARPSATEARPRMPTVAVDFRSSPAGAELFLDGQSQGKTPLRLELDKGRAHQAVLEKPSYVAASQNVVARERAVIEIPLTLTEEARERLMDRTEWFAFTASGGYSATGSGAGGAGLQFATLKWGSFHWTILDFGGGVAGEGPYFHLGTLPSWALRWGRLRQHQLRLGLGLGFCLIDDTRRVSNTYAAYEGGEAASFALSPTVGYYYQSSGRLYTGVALSVFLPTTGIASSDDGHDYSYPALLLVTVPLGWSSAPIVE